MFKMQNFIIILLTIFVISKQQEIDVNSTGNKTNVISTSTSRSINVTVNKIQLTSASPPIQQSTTDSTQNVISDFDFLQENIGFNPNDFEDLPSSSIDDDNNDSDLGIDSSQSFELHEYSHQYPEKFINQYVDDETSSVDILQPHDDGVNIEKSTKTTKLKRKILESLDHIQVIGKHDSSSKLKPNNLKIVASSKSMNNSNLGDFYTPTSAMVAWKNWKMDEQNQFYQITNLFDHFAWDVKAIVNNVSTKCGEQMGHYLWNLRAMTQWAVKASDSSGHYAGKLIFGNEFWIGSKVFCNEINMQYKANSGFMGFDYSLAIILFNIKGISKRTKPLSVGQCLPKACTINDIQIMLKLDPAYHQLASSITTTITANTSKSSLFLREFQLQSIRKVPGTYSLLTERKFYVLCAIVSLILLTMFVATYFEDKLKTSGSCSEYQNPNTINHRKVMMKDSFDGEKINCSEINLPEKTFELYQMNVRNNNNNNNLETTVKIDDIHECKKQPKIIDFFIKLLLCFSITSNSKRILSMEKLSEGSISCIHGIRTICLLWIIMVHSCLQLYAISNNKFDRKIAERNFAYQMVGNATYSVDTFFFISGLLVTLLFYRSKTTLPTKQPATVFIKNGTTKSFLLIGYRYLRLTPAYFFVIVMVELSFKYVMNKSVFYSDIQNDVMCEKYWWRNILYINNWYPFREFCMLWSWYLANDMQLYIIIIILLIFSARYFKFCLGTLMTLLFSSWIISAYFSFENSYTHKVAEPFESFDYLYDKPWQRIGPYTMGMIAAYIFYHYKTPPKIDRKMNLLLWTLSLGILFLTLFGVWNGRLSVMGTAFYVSLGHTGWGLGLIWIVLSCCWGYAKPVNNILSYPLFYPLSRLTYCAYLIHPLIQILTKHNTEGTMHLDHVFLLLIFLGTSVVSYIIAFFISIAFEAPTLRILKLIFKS